MAKFHGQVGYAIPEETSPGVWIERIIEREYYGDVNRNTRRLESSGTLNDNINVTNIISIVADPFANTNFHYICYAEFNIEVKYPRLELTMGGVYNGEQA